MEMQCQLCEREVPTTTRHHLIPRTVHKNKWFKKNYTFEEFHTTVDLCRDCHKEIHRLIPHKEMGRSYNSIALLKNHPKVNKFIAWLTR